MTNISGYKGFGVLYNASLVLESEGDSWVELSPDSIKRTAPIGFCITCPSDVTPNFQIPTRGARVSRRAALENTRVSCAATALPSRQPRP